MIKCSNCGRVSKDPTTERCPYCDAATATLVDMKVAGSDDQTDEQTTEVSVAAPGPPPVVLPEGMRFCLILTSGEAAQEEGRHLVFTEEEQIIGRAETVDVYIALPSLSRQHAAFWLEGGVPRIRDLGSLAGTLVNGVRITSPASLRKGDRVSLGESVHLLTTLEEGPVPRRGDLTVEKTVDAVLEDEPDDEPGAAGRRPHLAVLAELCAALPTVADEAELLDTVLEHLERAIPATRFLALMGESVDELTAVAERRGGGGPEPAGPPSKGILRRVMYSLSSRPFVTCDAQGEDGFKRRRSIMVSDIHAVICAGLTDGQTCIGLLYADGPEVGEIGADDEHFLFIVSRLTHDRIVACRQAGGVTRPD